MPPKMKFEQIDEHGSMVHSVISCSLSFHGKGCCDPSTIGDYTLSFNGLYFLSCTVIHDIQARGAEPGDDQVAPLEERVAGQRRQGRRAGVPTAMVELVARVRHRHRVDDL